MVDNNDDATLRLSPKVYPDGEVYLPDGRRLVNVHDPSLCAVEWCSIHRPSPQAEAIGYSLWREDRGLMERVCTHGVGHPDPDHMAHLYNIAADPHTKITRSQVDAEGVHGCDGCCRGAYDIR